MISSLLARRGGRDGHFADGGFNFANFPSRRGGRNADGGHNARTLLRRVGCLPTSGSSRRREAFGADEIRRVDPDAATAGEQGGISSARIESIFEGG